MKDIKKWSSINEMHWTPKQQRVIDDIADLEVRTLDLLLGVYRIGLTGRPRVELEKLIEEYKQRILS